MRLQRSISCSFSIISEVIPSLATLNCFLTKDNPTQAGVGTMKDTMKKALDNRFKDVSDNIHFVLATALDPRFKIAFMKDKLPLIKNILQEEIKIPNDAVPEPEPPIGPPPQKTSRHTSFWEVYDEIANSSNDLGPSQDQVES